MDAVCEAADRLFHWDFFYLAHRPTSEQRFRVVRVFDMVDGQKKSFPGYSADPPKFSKPVQQVFEGVPLLINRKAGRSRPKLILLGTKRPSASLMFVPVRGEGRVIGFLSAQSYTPGRYAESDLELLQDLADAVAPALERIHADEELREAKDLLERRVMERTAELRDANRQLQAEITEREQAQQALANSEQKHRLLIETNAIGYVILDGQGCVVDANQEYVRLTGRQSLNDILGRPVTEWTTEQDIVRNAEEVRKCQREGLIRGLEITYCTPSGELVPVEINAAALLTQSGARILGLVQDISDRRRAERALRESEARFRMLTEYSLVGILIFQDGMFKYVNPALAGMLGYSPVELLTLNPIQSVHPEDRARVSELIQRRVEGNLEVADYACRLIHKSGKPIEVRALGRRIAYQDRPAILGTIMDITERKRAEESLKERERQMRALSENLADGMVYQINSGPDGQRRQFTYLSPAVVRLHGLEVEDTRKDPMLLYNQLVDEDRALLAEREARAFAARKTLDAEVRVRLPSGEVRWRHFVASPRMLADGSMVWDGIEMDITDRKLAEARLLRKEEELRCLGIQANLQLEEERARISRELHDELGQILTALNLNLNWLGRQIGDVRGDITERLDESVQYIGALIASVRTLSRSLRPAALGHRGLVEAVRLQAAEFEQFSGLSCEVLAEPQNLEVKELVAITAFRIIQEALTNVARHSRGTKCSVTMQTIGELLLLRISDDGVGFPVKPSTGAVSLGIPGMCERAAMLGGTVSVQDRPGGGVCVTVQLPLTSATPDPDSPA